MSANDGKKHIEPQDESRDAARARLERRRGQNADDACDDDVLDLSGRGTRRSSEEGSRHDRSFNEGHSGSNPSEQTSSSSFRDANYIATLLSSLSSIPRSVWVCVIAALLVFCGMFAASRFGHSPEIATANTSEETNAVTEENEANTEESEDDAVVQNVERADFSQLPAGLDSKTLKGLEAKQDDPRVVRIVNDAASLARTGEHYQRKMLELAAKDPEALDYVADFPNRYPASSGTAYSDTVARGSVPDLKQWDQRWGYVEYCGAAIGSTGCCPTSLSMVYMALTGKADKTPADMAALATADGYAVDGEGTIGEFLVDDAGKLGLACEEFSPSAASLVRYLKNGFIVIVNVGPGDFTDSGHFFVARGVASDGSIQINDPYSSVNTAKTWDANSIANQSIMMYAFHAA